MLKGVSKEKYGQSACVIGAAEGLGAAFSMELARRGFELLLVDIKVEELEKLKDRISENFQVSVSLLIVDLKEYNSWKKINAALNDHNCRFLVYNAAYGPVKKFLSNDHSELDAYLDVNVRSLIHLIREYVELPITKKKGILFLSSLAGFTGTRFVSPYSGTKAFIWNFAEGLHYEFENEPIDIGICIPGAIDTPNFRATNPKKTSLSPTPMLPEKVAFAALNKFGRRLFIIPGFLNQLTFLLFRLLPRSITSATQNRVMKEMYDKN